MRALRDTYSVSLSTDLQYLDLILLLFDSPFVYFAWRVHACCWIMGTVGGIGYGDEKWGYAWVCRAGRVERVVDELMMCLLWTDLVRVIGL